MILENMDSEVFTIKNKKWPKGFYWLKTKKAYLPHSN